MPFATYFKGKQTVILLSLLSYVIVFVGFSPMVAYGQEQQPKERSIHPFSALGSQESGLTRIAPPPQVQYQTILAPARTLTVQPTTTTNLPPATIYPPGITATNPYLPQAYAGTLPPSAVTFPPSVFPPTTSFAPPTTIAPVAGPLSPWFPSIPAVACGGTFTLTVTGELDRSDSNHDNDDNRKSNDNNKKDKNNKDKDDGNNDDRKLYAIQIQSNGGTSLDAESVEGTVFAGENNIERNNGEDFDIDDVFNDCQVTTFSD
jgi:hypothetical protein